MSVLIKGAQVCIPTVVKMMRHFFIIVFLLKINYNVEII